MKRFFTSWWTISIFTTVVLILIFAVGLPYFVDFLDNMFARIGVTVFFIAMWGLWFFLRRRKAKKLNADLEEQLEEQDKGAEEAGLVAKRMKEALANLRKASGKQRNYLYTRPWYVIIGPPGAGKTTAIINSGLRFPFSDQASNATAGTRNLDFWFADEAVLVDTAGRYTTQDSQADVDASGWTSLLKLLRKSRPFEPINGVFVAIPTDDLLRGDVHEIDRHSVIIRQRLHEIRSTLESKVPVYLLLTKSDLIAGFPEYFADLDVDGRRAVLGYTFKRDGSPIDSARMVRAFDGMTNQIAARQPKRLYEEPDIKRRSVILGFPSQLHELRAPLHRLIEGVFLKEERPSGELRGFYLTSGTQDGTALDRIINTVAESYALDTGPAQSGEGRTFFLNRLLQDVVFKEAGLPIADASATKRQRTWMIGICSAIAVASLAMIAAWTVSFIGNRGLQAETASEAIAINQEMAKSQIDLSQVSDTDTPITGALVALDRLRALPEGYEAREAGSPDLSMRFGLFQSDLSKRNVEAYRTGLRRILLPRVMLDLENRLQTNMSDPFAIYDPLKTYLMLGGHHPEGEVNTDAIINTMMTQWSQNQFPGAENRPLREKLAMHLEALTKDENLQASWPNGEAPLDALLVDAARGQIATLSPADRAYAILKQQSINPEGDVRLSNELQAGEAEAFADPQLVMNTTVPYFFTRQGFFTAYGTGLAGISQTVEKELWVLGEGANTDGVRRELGNLTSGISKRYASDYIAAWENVIEAMRPGDYFGDDQAYRAFTRAPSPLKKVLTVLRTNTTFTGGVEGELGEKGTQMLENTRMGRMASDLAGAAADNAGMSADSEIKNHFTQVHDFVGDGDGPAPIDEYVGLVRDALKAVLVSGSPGLGQADSGSRLAEAMAPLSQAAIEVPSLLSGFAEEVSQGGNSAGVSSLQTEVGQAWAANAQPQCSAIVDAKYPFDRASTADAGITETRELFGTNGTIDRFAKERVGQYLDRESEYWGWRQDAEVARGFSPASPGAFQKAATLGALFDEGLPLRIALADMGEDVSRVEFSSGGLPLIFEEPNPNEGQSLNWTLGGGLARTTVIRILAWDPATGGESVVWTQNNEGPWSLFRVFDFADARNRGEGLIQMTFNPGPSNATFLVEFPPRFNPFGGGGVWSANCPEVL
jgi:type VI secretion system protein ImpL